MEAKVDMRKLQLLNDRITQTIDALNEVRLSMRGLSPSAYPGFVPTMPGMMMPGMMMSGMSGLSHSDMERQMLERQLHDKQMLERQMLERQLCEARGEPRPYSFTGC